MRVGRPHLAGTLLRAAFAVIFAVTGFLLGREAYNNLLSLHAANETTQLAFLILSPVVGAIVGVLLAPLAQSVFEKELDVVEGAMERLQPSELAGGAAGLTAGLVIAFLIKSIVFESISLAGRTGTYVAIVLYIIVSIFAAYLGARVGAKMRLVPVPPGKTVSAIGVPKIIDTSVIVDGRVTEIVQSGFLEGPFVVPRFVLRELQAIADSSDAGKRQRGRRGLDVLARLQEIVPLDIEERDYEDLPHGSVDAKLVRLTLDLGGKLVTNDYNLSRVAHVEGVEVLSVHELASALRPIVLPGEELRVQLLREGKEPHQAVGYLEDGTMVVVEHSRRSIGETMDVVVTSVLQTVAGRMIFARPRSVLHEPQRWSGAP